jgi:hypothetical protein
MKNNPCLPMVLAFLGTFIFTSGCILLVYFSM